MLINEFARLVCKEGGLKEEINIAQVSETMRIINNLTGGVFYKFIFLLYVRETDGSEINRTEKN